MVLVAGAAIGYFLLPMIFPIQATDGRQTYFTDDDPNDNTPTGTLTNIPGLVIKLTTQSGDSLELSFTTNLIWWPSTPPAGYTAKFLFAIDGVSVLQDLFIYDYCTISTPYSYAIAYRFLATGLSPGIHNVTVQVQVSGTFMSVACDGNVLSVLIF